MNVDNVIEARCTLAISQGFLDQSDQAAAAAEVSNASGRAAESPGQTSFWLRLFWSYTK
jgi:hypothetical protein